MDSCLKSLLFSCIDSLVKQSGIRIHTLLCNIFRFSLFNHQNLYPYDVKFAYTTYQILRKTTALLLLLAFLLPSGLQAKQLAEFCMPNHHKDMEMMADHSCCQPIPEKASSNEHQQHNCDEASLCTCNISESIPGEEEFVQPVKKQILKPSETESETPFYSTHQPKQAEIHNVPANSNIPLWLMFDTFLM